MQYLDKNELKTLDKVVSLLQEYEIKYWLDQGSLLGAVRDEMFFSWDHDIDLGVLQSDIDEVRPKFVINLRESGYKVKDTEHALKISLHNRSDNNVNKTVDLRIYKKVSKYYEAKLKSGTGNKRVNQLKRRLLKKVQKFIHKITYRYKNLNRFRLIYNILFFVYSEIEESKYRTVIFRVESDYFDELTSITVYGKKYLAPKNYQQYLKLKYGANWRTPIKDWKYWEDDGALFKVSYK